MIFLRTSIGLTTLFKSLFAFTLLFTAFLTLAIVYNKAFKLKNEVISILEKHEGLSTNSLKIINNYLANNNYRTTANCEVGEYGVKDLNNNIIEEVTTSNVATNYYYCMSQHCSMQNCAVSGNNNIYYNFKLFFKFELPFLGDLLTFPVNGETKGIRLYYESQRLGG